MPITKAQDRKPPQGFLELVAEMPPQAIMNDAHYQSTLERIDCLMAAGRLTRGRQLYLETLVQLVQAYEAAHHAVDTGDLRGVDALAHLLEQHEMTASDLGRLLGVHPSMGSKILKGERSLTVEHLRKLADRFSVRPELFMD